jgi:hypothetical protein
MGEVSADPEVQAAVKEKVASAEEQGLTRTEFRLPPVWHKRLRRAITIAPSVYFQQPMPVCWVHLQGMSPDGSGRDQNTARKLLVGKDHRNTIKREREKD